MISLLLFFMCMKISIDKLDGLLFLFFNDNVYEEDNFFICYGYITDLLCV